MYMVKIRFASIKLFMISAVTAFICYFNHDDFALGGPTIFFEIVLLKKRGGSDRRHCPHI